MLNQQISHYLVVEQIGEGGMGIVYKAIDVNLDREVALKVLPDELTQDPRAVARLHREARAASALNDPGICTIYEIGDHDGTVFIAMELLDGETLARRLRRGPMPAGEAIDLALAVVASLDHAHTRGVLHRDISPANLFLTSSGRVKLLDFGLARNESTAGMTVERTQTITATGHVIGTLPYMSPEQAKGEPLDARTDLFSFGIVLHEALSGRRMFSGSTAEVMTGILTKPPEPVSMLVPGVPADLDHVIAKALEKDRDLRYQTAAEFRTDLKRLKRDFEQVGAVAARPSQKRIIAMATGAAALVAAVVALVVMSRREEPARPAASPLAAANFVQVSNLPGLETFPSLSADGESLVFASAHEGRWRIYSQRVGGRNLLDLTATPDVDDSQPALSPDGKRIAFRSTRQGGGIFVMGATGESVRRVTDIGFNPVWSPDSASIAFATEVVEAPTSRMAYSAVWAVDVATGARRLVTEDNAVQPSWSPHGQRIAYWKVDSSGTRDIYTVPASGGPSVAVTNDPATDWSPTWSPDGRFLYFSSDRGGSMNLWRVPIDEATGHTTGAFEPFTTPALNSGLLSFSRDGSRIAYVAQTLARNVMRVGFDAKTEKARMPAEPVTVGTRYLRFPAISPDGKSIAYTSDEKLMVGSVDGRQMRQLTDGEFRDRAPRWSPDGATLWFYTNRTGTYEIWRIRPDASGLQQMTFGGHDITFFYPVPSPDGTRVAYGDLRNRRSYVLDITKPWGAAAPLQLPPMTQPRSVFAPWAWSRSGLAGWVLREDGAAGGVVVFDPAAGKFTTLGGTGTRPEWLPDGKRLMTIESGGLAIVDAVSGARRPIELRNQVDEDSLAPDGSAIYFMQSERTGDIWLISLNAPAKPAQ